MHKDIFKFDLICNVSLFDTFNNGKRQENIKVSINKEDKIGQQRFDNSKQQ